MQRALVDSNVLVAATSARDDHHDTARRIVGAADRSELPALTVTNYVLAETLNYVSTRGRHSKAVELHERLDESTGFDFARGTKQDDEGAIDRFTETAAFSFVDAFLGSYAARTGIEFCYSFDDDLERHDHVTRLASDVDPYAPG